MPRISSFHGIVIEMYFGDHAPPHVHARFSGEVAKVSIVDGSIIVGSIPRRAHRLVREWIELHKEELEDNWTLAVQLQPPRKIDPLP